MMFLKQSTAVDVMLGPFVDDTDGKTTEEALTLSQADLQLTKNAGAAAQKNDATSATHIYGGCYKVPLNTTDTNTLGRLTMMCKETGALPVKADFMVIPANVYDSLIGGSDNLQVDTVQVGGTTQTAGDILGTWTPTKAGYLTGDAFVRLGAPAGISVSADIAAVKSDSAAILADTGTDGVVVAAGSKLGYSLAADQSGVTVGIVNSATLANGAHGGAAASLTLASYSNFRADVSALATSAEIAALNNLSSADVTAAVPTTAEIKMAMEADGGDLSILVEALVNKMVITEANGNTEMFDDAGVSSGSVTAAFTSDGTYTTRKRMVIP